MATIRDVAKHAGVSVATVSRVINSPDKVSEETCRRVQQSIEALGFEPDFLARTWRTRETRTIAAVMSDNTSPHHGVTLREAAVIALAHDYNLLLCTTFFDPEIERRYLRMLRMRKVDGILLNNASDCKDEIAKFAEMQVPVVLLNRPLGDYGPMVDAVVVDSYRGSFDLVEHLIQTGHQRIGLVYSAALHKFHQHERLRGYCDALSAHGIPYDESLVRSIPIGRSFRLPLAPNTLAFPTRPTALYAAGYGTGLAVMTLVREQGLRVPEDIAFAMFDDVMWGEFVNPPLTLVRNPGETLGRVAMELIFARMADRQRPRQEVRLQPALIVRRSCGCPSWLPGSSTPAAST